jgi:probable rRNA maturation factor
MPSFFIMESDPHPISIENRSSARLPRGPLTVFAQKVRSAVRLKGDVGILIASNRELRRLNREFRGKDKPTDVLSFPSEIPGYAGDIAISAEIARQSARQRKLTLTEETKVLILHGMLHLAGFDHETDNGEMARKEQVLRRRLGLTEALLARANGLAPRKAKR